MKSVCTLLSLFLIGSAAHAADPTFNQDIRSIFAENCFACHGFDAKARKAKLRLDTPEGAFTERKGITPIVPGKPDDSEVYLRLISDDPTLVMPPPETKKKLTPEQIATLKKWIESGAKYQKHWSFEPIEKPPVPQVKPPVANPIDAFIQAKLAEAKLPMSPEADRTTLIRRIAFTLTGLPPSVAEVDAFLADRSPNAYEKLVDRYLASPRYGEEMARHWLDVARYADTHGLHLDNERTMWLYRDWVVKAFNQNLPFDQFTLWQIAGDLLPNPTPDQLVATGFNRCNVSTSEGGSISVEWLFRNAVDRAGTTAEAFLGLTAGCAVCHDHKFDPITQKEFYSLYAFFYSSADPAMDGNISTTPPFYKRPTPEQTATLNAARTAETQALKALQAAAMKTKYIDPVGSKSGKQVVSDLLFDDDFAPGITTRNTSRNASKWLDNPAFGAKSGRRVLKQANTNFHQDSITSQLVPVIMPANGKLEVWVRPDPIDTPIAVAVQVAGAGTKQFWWGREARAGEYDRGVSGTRLGDLPKPGEWSKLTLTAKELNWKPGQRITTVTLQEFGGVVYWDALSVSGESDPAGDPLASLQTWWTSVTKKVPAEVPADLRKLLAANPKGKHAPKELAKLQTYYLTHIARPSSKELADARRVWEAARAAREAAEEAIPGTFIFNDLPTPREAFVMLRGQYDKPGEKVTPGTPAALPPLKLAKADARPTRLDLAKWLISPEQPLTARVTANRFWQQVFGTGLVKTSFDFGTQGDSPSHPLLLDYLASDLRDSGWNVKKFMKQLVMSRTFRQQSRVSPEIQERDPANRLYARGPRFRLDAEQLRDNALAVSGLINLKMGGRGVNTYQPPNIWEPVGYGDSNTRYYLQDHGPALYRRSIYVFLKRTAPPPFIINFDGTNREQTCTVRDRTNTPLQALQLLNDTQHFEAARALAERVLSEGGSNTPDRITLLYRTVLARSPDAEEIRIVSGELAKQLAIFQKHPDAAKQVVEVGESTPKRLAADDVTASWTMIANLVLNLDETVNRN